MEFICLIAALFAPWAIKQLEPTFARMRENARLDAEQQRVDRERRQAERQAKSEAKARTKRGTTRYKLKRADQLKAQRDGELIVCRRIQDLDMRDAAIAGIERRFQEAIAQLFRE